MSRIFHPLLALSLAAIAEDLGQPPTTVAGLLRRGLHSLRRKLTGFETV
jgi:DNA-directed RNA polymerase specialized sigma24 family protein